MPSIQSFFDEDTSTLTYLIESNAECAVIDPVLNLDLASGRTSTQGAQKIRDVIQSNGWDCRYLLETHIHADHVSASPWLKEQLGGEIIAGHNLAQVQGHFSALFNLANAEDQPFDRLVDEQTSLPLGHETLHVMETPGHTPACLSYRIGDAVFVGDTLFMPDYGTARCDFPGGCAATLWDSIEKILSLPDATRVFTGHDYRPGGRALAFESSVAEQRQTNIHLQDGKAAFVETRNQRDATLATPKLMLPSIQTNICAGRLPEPESNGVAYLKIPLNAL